VKILAFVPDQDSPGKKDMTHAFMPEARAFVQCHKAAPEDSIVRFPMNADRPHRRGVCTLALKAATEPLDVIAFFCHGWQTGLQAGFEMPHVLQLARLIGLYAKIDAYVLLYACSTAGDADGVDDERLPGVGGDGGFADGLRDACEALGRRVTVVGHTTAGHCAQNPHARFFAPNQGGKGGRWFVEPGSHLWPLWVAALKDPRSSLRYRYWWLTPEEIAAQLVPGIA
jgi:hypothetical protein